MRSFSRAFITIQSSSPRSSFVSFAGSMLRLAAMLGSASAVLSLRARPRRLLLADHPQHFQNAAAWVNCLRSSGGVPVSSS